MFGNRKRVRSTRIDSLIGRQSVVEGSLSFSGGLHVDGVVKGNVSCEPGSLSVLTLSEYGTIEGEVRVPTVVLNGTVKGNVYASEHVELAPNARVVGDVHYHLIEMAVGAEVNGNLVHDLESPGPDNRSADVPTTVSVAGDSNPEATRA